MSKTQAHIRYRTADNKIVPGITTVIGSVLAKPALVPWANKLGLAGIDSSKYVDDKAEIGTLAHAFVTDKLMGKDTDTSDYSANQILLAEGAAAKFWEWAKGHDLKPIYVETPLVSEMYRFGGTQDIYCELDGQKVIVDLKTGKGIYDEAVYQVSALGLLSQENGHPVDGARILNIPRAEEETFAEKICTKQELDKGWQIFYHCLMIYNLRKK